MDPNYNNLNQNNFSGMPYPGGPSMPYINKAINETKGYYDPYTQNAGNPEDVINRIASTFQKSPAYNVALQDRIRAQEAAAANSGRINTPGFERQIGELAGSFYTDEMRKYIQDVMGQQGLGLQAAGMAAGDVGNLYQTAGQSAFNQDAQKRKDKQDMMRAIISTIGTIGGGAVAGPPGAAGGSALAQALFKLFGSSSDDEGYGGYNTPGLNSSNLNNWMNY